MANFLSRLAARAIGSGPVAQPLIAPLFAGRSSESPEPIAQQSQSSVANGDVAPAYEQPRTERPIPPTHAFPHAETDSVPEHQSVASRLHLELETLPSLPESTGAALTPADSHAAPQREFHSPAHHRHTDRSQLTESPPQERDDAPATLTPFAETERLPSHAIPRAQTRPANAFATPPPRAAYLPSRREEFAAHAPQIVRVTIGRVDVRAQFTTPQNPPAKSVRRPAMSLEDYAKQRSEGKR